MKRLSDEAIEGIWAKTWADKNVSGDSLKDVDDLDNARAIARAAGDEILKQVVEWGSGVCDKEHGFSVGTGKACLWKDCWRKPIFRRNCKKCWQSLKQQIEEGK